MAKIILRRGASCPRGTSGFGVAPPAEAEAGAPIEDASESHTLCIAPTGTGKSRSVVVPNLLIWEGSAVVIDIKGELAHLTARRRREMGQRVVVIDPWARSIRS
jgi:type IV secretion system protein VirD4